MAKKKQTSEKASPRRPSQDPVKMAAKVFATMPGDGKNKPRLRLSK